ncbi:hypothetical protein L798_07825 [Zootermopsis nevadensis]|uniref:Uncharacterized protein n=1 Tax=Zootermopsis nevadensis TaxID=136037 RepID=A0A067R596_ZOONE|nr:hypothetical protein L798_07825 [Zootermopsis nevadensis]
MMPAGTLIHYECRPHPLAAEARTTSGSPSIDTVLKRSDRTSYKGRRGFLDALYTSPVVEVHVHVAAKTNILPIPETKPSPQASSQDKYPPRLCLCPPLLTHSSLFN